MRAGVMIKRIAEVSPRFKARMAGVLFLFLVLTSTFTEFFARGRLSFAAHIAAGVIEVSCMIAVTLLFYYIFKPVDMRFSLLAASFNFVAVTILLLQFLPHSVNIGLGFHGFYWILISYLILRSTFLPRFLSALTAIAGLCWLTFLSPTLTTYLSPYVMAFAFLVEGSVFLWLLVFGVNEQRWKEQAGQRVMAIVARHGPLIRSIAKEVKSMSTDVMMERIGEASPRFKARIAGVFYLLTILARMFVEIFVRNRLVVSDDAAATATNILAHEPLWRWGFAADIIAFASYIALMALLYELFKPVNRSLSLVAAFFSLVAAVVQAISSLFHLAPLVLLGGAPYLSVFTVEQLQTLALVFLRLRAAAYHNIGLVFFGLYCLLVGILILRSTFLPRILGVLMVLAGLSYVLFLSPPLARSLQPYILVFPGVGQISLTLWLLAIGVNAQRWKEQASAAAFVTN